MKSRMRNGLTVALALAVAGCASSPTADSAAPAMTTTFLIVRHAEKADGGNDPVLTPAGQARAQALAARLAGQPLRAAYATAYRRTQETARPVAQAQGLQVTTYEAGMPARSFAEQLRREHVGGQVLVVGHSNTVPQIAAALCACEVAPMNEAEYDRLITVRTDAEGPAVLREERY